MDETVSGRLLHSFAALKCCFRLKGCQPDVEVWQRVLQVRTLVLNAVDDPMMWIKFANLCRKNDRMPLAEKTINSLLMGSERVSWFHCESRQISHRLVEYEIQRSPRQSSTSRRLCPAEVHVGQWVKGP